MHPTPLFSSPPSDTPQYFSVETLAEIFDVSVGTIWRWHKEGRTPRLIKIGPNCTRAKSTDWVQFICDPKAWHREHRKEFA